MLTKRVSSIFGSIRNMANRGKATPKVAPSAPQEFHVGKKLAEKFWLPGQKAATFDVSAAVLQNMRRATSKRLGGECCLVSAKASSMTGGDSHLLCITKAGVIIGLYEVSDYADGALFKRVCCHPVREMIRNNLLPAEWPKKYEPVNSYGGSRKLPSRGSVRDISVMSTR